MWAERRRARQPKQGQRHEAGDAKVDDQDRLPPVSTAMAVTATVDGDQVMTRRVMDPGPAPPPRSWLRP